MDELAPMIVMCTLILTTGGVLVLRPIAKRLGSFPGRRDGRQAAPVPGGGPGRASTTCCPASTAA